MTQTTPRPRETTELSAWRKSAKQQTTTTTSVGLLRRPGRREPIVGTQQVRPQRRGEQPRDVVDVLVDEDAAHDREAVAAAALKARQVDHTAARRGDRSEEHTSAPQSRLHL